MPAKERLRRHKERRPPVAWLQPARSGHDHSVDPGEARSLHPAAQDRELVAQHGVLDLEGSVPGPATGEAKPPAQHRVEEGEEHRRIVRRRWSGRES